MRSINDAHVLAVQRLDGSGGETYWDGKLTPAGFPKRTSDVNRAAVFRNAAEAYRAGKKHARLSVFRAVRPMYRKHFDGFMTRWWIKE